MICSNCGKDLTDEMFQSGMCFNCGNPVQKSEKVFSENEAKMQKEILEEEMAAKELFRQENINKLKNHKITTGYNFENYKIIEYKGLVSGEVVIGTGWLSTVEAGMSDFLGIGSYTYSEKMKQAKEAAISDMVQQSVSLGGNAAIGISFEFMTFSGDMIGVSVNGTSVKIASLPDTK